MDSTVKDRSADLNTEIKQMVSDIKDFTGRDAKRRG